MSNMMAISLTVASLCIVLLTALIFFAASWIWWKDYQERVKQQLEEADKHYEEWLKNEDALEKAAEKGLDMHGDCDYGNFDEELLIG